MKLNLKLKLVKLKNKFILFYFNFKQNLIKFKSKKERLINKYNNNLILFKDFIKTTKFDDFKKWQLKEDKFLYIVLIEWLLNDVLYYVLIGLFVALALTINNFIGLWLKATIGYLLLNKVVLLIKGKGD